MESPPPTRVPYSTGARLAIAVASVLGVILAVLLALWGYAFVHRSQIAARIDLTNERFAALASSLTNYHNDMGGFPPWKASSLGPELNLQSWGRYSGLVVQQYFDVSVLDPFGAVADQPLRYWSDSKGWTIWSAGPNRKIDLVDPNEYAFPGLQAQKRMTSFLYDPTNGLVSSGDMVYIYRQAPDD